MRRAAVVVVFVGLVVAGLAAGTFASGREANANSLGAASLSKVTRVSVIATDSRFKLSTRRAPMGTVMFTVTNKGTVSHDFKIAGKKTRRLSPGHSATLRVTFSKKGRYTYRSTVHGQAAGLKGVFVVVAAPAPPPPPPPTGTVGTAKTTVAVGMFEQPTPRFVLSQLTMPSGMVTFVITSYCPDLGCSFHLDGVKAGAILLGGSETWTVPLPPGRYNFHCDVDPLRMYGALTVTP